MKAIRPNFTCIDEEHIKRLDDEIMLKNEFEELLENPLIEEYLYIGFIPSKNLIHYGVICDGYGMNIFIKNV